MEANLHDDGVLVLIHSNNPNVMKEIYDWAYTWAFNVAKDWWSLNELHLTSPIDPTELMSLFVNFSLSF